MIIEWSFTAFPSTATDKAAAARLNARAALRIAALVLLFAGVGSVHIATRRLFKTSNWPRRFLAAAAWIIGVRVTLEGRRPEPHTLLIANHTSWLDILVLGGATGCAFVSKDQLGHWLIHWLADQNGTVYVSRTDRKGAKNQAIAVAKGLERAQPVVIFPEGTTGPGSQLLPFRSTLLEAANFAARDVTIRSVALDYHDERATVGWYEEPGTQNVIRLLGRRGKLRVTVRLLADLDRSLDRKQLTGAARDAIAQSLGLTLLDHSPIDEAK